MKTFTVMVIGATAWVMLVAWTPVYAATLTTNTIADAYIGIRGDGGYATDNHGTNSQLEVAYFGNNNWWQKGYMRFDISAMGGVVGSASLSLVYAGHLRLDPGETVVHDVYGLVDGTAGETGWAETGITWLNAPGGDGVTNTFVNATYLGSIIIDGNHPVGTVYRFASSSLAEFINADSNGEVTIMMTGKNAMPPDYSRAYYASKEHETLAAPQLTLSSEIEIEMETTADSYVRDHLGTLRDTNYGTESGLHLVHQAADKTIKAYMRFTLADQLKPVGETTLSLVYSTGANFEAGETVLHSIYGLDDGTAGETTWGETGITWNNAPGNDADLGLTNATLLGTITVIGDNAVGTTYTLSSSELSAFLNADSNGEITIIMVPGTLQTEWAGYASKEHGIYAAPRLSVSVPMGPIITFR